MKNGKENFKKKLLIDGVLILVLLIVALSAFLFYNLKLRNRGEGEYAVVRYKNEIIGEYPLSADGEFTLNGGSNVLKIEDGKAFVIDADCPDKVCINTGKISLVEDKIICAPNFITITIE